MCGYPPPLLIHRRWFVIRSTPMIATLLALLRPLLWVEWSVWNGCHKYQSQHLSCHTSACVKKLAYSWLLVVKACGSSCNKDRQYMVPGLSRILLLIRSRELHESHQLGMVHTKERARLTVYWSSMDIDIKNTILTCKLCQNSLPSWQTEPIVLKSKSQQLFQEIAAEFCSHAGQ